MEEKDISEPPTNTSSTNNNPQVGRYFTKFTVTSLPQDFYQKIIELENEIQLSSRPSMDTIKELGGLYKKGIEAFCTTSPKKVQYFSKKLTKLLIGVDKLAKRQNKQPSKWSQYMNSHKKNYNKFLLFLELEESKQDTNEIINSQEKKFANLFNEYDKSMLEQENNFKAKLQSKKLKKITDEKNNLNKNNSINNEENEKKIVTYVNKMKGRNELLDTSLKDFIKKFHYVYLRSKIFDKPIESFNFILDDMFCHKVTKYYYYQDQIKEFELMLGDKDDDRGGHDESIEGFLKDLINERKNYYITLDNYINQIKKRIEVHCAQKQISQDKHMKKYLQELMDNVAKMFK